MSNSTLQRSAPAPSAPRASSATVSNLLANYGLLFVFLLIMLVFGLLRPSSFFSATNLNAILVSQSVTAILALAAMVPLATKQFDLSIGYHLGMAQVLIVGLQVTQSLGWPLAAALILLASLVVGFVNGLLVTFFRIDSFIATMGTGTLLYGVTNWYTNGEQIVGMSLPDSFTGLTQIVHGVPLPAVYVAIIAVALWVVTERLPVGRNLYVIGANVRAAELTGINVRRHVMGAFVVAGLLSSFAGIVLGSILSEGNSERWSRISSASFRWEPARRHFDQTRSSQRDRGFAFGARARVFVLRRAAAWRPFLRSVFLQREHPDRGSRPLGLRRPAAPARRHGHEAGRELKGEEPVDPFETLDKRFAPHTIPIVFPRRA